MYFRYQQTANLLEVADTFARLVQVQPNGDLSFEFTYTIDPHQAINHGAQVVSVSVLSRYVTPTPLLGSTQQGSVDTQSLVDNIRSMILSAKQTQHQQDMYVVARANSNIVSFVNNEVLQMVRAQVPARNIPQLNSPQLQLVTAGQAKQLNDPQPILQRVVGTAGMPNLQQALTASVAVNPQQLMQDMISRQGLDPSYIVELTRRSQSDMATRGGLSNPSTAQELPTDPAAQLLSLHLFPPTSNPAPTTTDQTSDGDLVQVLATATTTTVEVPVAVVLPRANLQLDGVDVTSVFVQFDLVSTTSGEPIDSIVKKVDLTRELQVFNTPRQPPVLKAAVSPASSRALLQVRQVDPAAVAVRVYKKSLFVASAEVDTYALVGEYPLRSNSQALQVRVDVPLTSATIYRVIPVGAQGILGFEFSSTVVGPPRYVPLRSVALTGLQVDQGIQLEARNIPTKCVAIQFLKKNLTTFDSTYTTVNGDVGLVDDATRAAGLVLTIDTDVFDANVYQYVARLIYGSGITEDFGCVTLEFVQPAPGEVDTAITDLVVSHNNVPDVSFTIVTTTASTDIDAIKQMLGNQDLQQFFQGDLQAQRDQLQQLVAHSVQRVDLTTGVREDFGTVTTSAFVDSELRQNRSIGALQYGHAYRYEIYPLLRASETLFTSLNKPAVDPTTNKPYTFLPSKYLHPLALTRGIIVTPGGAAQRYAKDPMSFGIVGSITSVPVSFDNDTAAIANQSATRFDGRLNIVSWQVQGDINQVDHFLVLKVVNGVKTLLGKAHVEFAHGSCQYFHQLTGHDNGGLAYSIVPVMNDYRIGQAATTNTVIVDVA